MTPTSARPYVGSTRTNSVFELAFERNGVDQVEGLPIRSAASTLGFAGGVSGVTRLLNRELGTQVGWFLPFGVVGGIAALGSTRLRRSPRLGAAAVLGVWFAGAAVVFSATAGVFHPYYLAELGPPLAGLVGVGISTFRFDLEARRRTGACSAAVALVLTALTQWAVWQRFGWRTWFLVVAVIAVGLVIAGGAIAWRRRLPLRGRASVRLTAAALVAILLAPAMWVQGSEAAGFSGAVPYAHPQPSGVVTTPANHITPNGGLEFPAISVTALVQYLRSQASGERWIVAVPSAAPAEEIVITSGEPVMAIGGFVGSDPILGEDGLRRLVHDGALRFFLLSTDGFAGGLALLSVVDTTEWVSKLCSTVPRTAWQADAPNDTEKVGTTAFVGGPRASSYALYDCRGAT